MAYNSSWTGAQIDKGVGVGLETAHRNLIDNWDFRNPVNQRGMTSESTWSINTYGIDRWKSAGSGGSPSVGNGFVELVVSAGGTYADIRQTLEQSLKNVLAGKQVTVSILSDNGINSTTGIFGSMNGYFAGIFRIWIGSSSSNDFILRNQDPGTAKKIYAVKLELGSVSTLANDPPMDFAAELAKCQRYFIRLGSGNYGQISLGYASGTTSISFWYFAPVAMRAPGVASVTKSGTIVAANGSDIKTLSTITLNPYQAADRNVISIDCAVSGATAGRVYQMQSQGGGYIDISCDL